MRILFWGTPDFAVPSLRALDEEGHEVVGVVTRPDRPAGRGRRLTPAPVRVVAEALGIPVLTPEKPRGEDFMAAVRGLAPELSVVVAYGHILRREFLDVPPLGSINVHASLLPELRGAAPINWAIARGHERTGVTVMRMVEAMDAGPVLHRVEEPILPDQTASGLTGRLAEVGAEALVEALALLDSGALAEEEQDHAQATFAPKVSREVARVDWGRPAREIAWHIRGMDAVPGAWSGMEGEVVKLFRPAALAAAGPGVGVGDSAGGLAPAPGTVLVADEVRGVVVAAGEGAVSLGEVQPSGKRRMRAQDWIHGRGVRAGQRFV